MTASQAPLANAPHTLSTSAVENERRAHEPSMEEILASIRKIIADEEALPLGRPSTVFAEARAAMRPPAPAASEPAKVTPFVAPQPRAPEAPVQSAPEAAEAARSAIAAPEPEPVAPAPSAAAPAADLRGAHFEETVHEVESDIADEAADDGAAPEQRVEAIEHAAPVVAAEEEARFQASAEDLPAEDLAAEDLLAEDLRFERRAAEDVPAEDLAPMLSPTANASVASAFQALSASVAIANSEMIERAVREMLRPMLKQWLDDNLPVMVERLVRTEIERVARGGR